MAATPKLSPAARSLLRNLLKQSGAVCVDDVDREALSELVAESLVSVYRNRWIVARGVKP